MMAISINAPHPKPTADLMESVYKVSVYYSKVCVRSYSIFYQMGLDDTGARC